MKNQNIKAKIGGEAAAAEKGYRNRNFQNGKKPLLPRNHPSTKCTLLRDVKWTSRRRDSDRKTDGWSLATAVAVCMQAGGGWLTWSTHAPFLPLPSYLPSRCYPRRFICLCLCGCSCLVFCCEGIVVIHSIHCINICCFFVVVLHAAAVSSAA
jgi:hypothetical protein